MGHYHLVFENNEWVLRKEHALSATLILGRVSWNEAVEQSTAYLLYSGDYLIIHNPDGTICKERAFPRGASMLRIRELMRRQPD